jgi:HK97 family phage portal protein
MIDLGYTYDVSGHYGGTGVGYSVWADPAAWQTDASGMIYMASQSSSGITVTPLTAMYSAAFWHGINTIAGDVGQITLELVRDNGQGVEVDRAHPAAKLLRRPHPLLRAGDFRELMQMRAIIYGNAVAKIERNGSGQPIELLPLHPEKTHIEYDERGQLWYRSKVDDEEVSYYPDEVFHLTSLSTNGLWGLPLTQVAQDVLGDELGLQSFALKSFANGAIPGGWLKVPGRLTSEKRAELRSDWQQIHGGLGNANSVGVLDSGKEFVPINSDHAGAQMVEARKFAVDQVARVLCLPAFKLNNYERATFSNVEEMQRQYLTALSRWLNKWEQEADAKLLTDAEFDGGELKFEWNTRKLIQADSKTRAEVEGIDIVNRVRSPNEIRRERGLPPYEGGDEFANPYTTSNSDTPADPPADPEELPEETTEESDDINTRLLRFHLLQLTQRESAAMNKAARDADTFDDFREAVASYYNADCRFYHLLTDSVAREYCTQRERDVVGMFDGDELQLMERLGADEQQYKQRAQSLVDRELSYA